MNNNDAATAKQISYIESLRPKATERLTKYDEWTEQGLRDSSFIGGALFADLATATKDGASHYITILKAQLSGF